MRRLTLLALSAALVVSACKDQAPTEPTAPAPQENLTSCRPVRFPFLRVSQLIVRVFPAGRLRIEALARAAAVALLWDTCKPVLARRGVVAFVDFMNRNSTRLIGTDQQKVDLIALMFTGVGLTSPPPVLPGPDFGIGGLDPNATTPTLIETQGSTALIQFLPAEGSRRAAFNEFTIISITRRPDNAFLDGFPEEDQHPPFFDYTATNASNNHVINAGAVATMVFCFLGAEDFPNPDGYPDGARIGHNPDASVVGAPPFEIIPAGPPSGPLAGNLECSNLQPTSGPQILGPSLIGGFGGGLPGFARAAWSTAGHYLAPIVRTLFLPQQVYAATVVGGRGPLSGLPPTLSDFGVVNATSYFGYENGELPWTPTGFWNRRTSAALTNSAFTNEFVATFNAPDVPGGILPTPFRGGFSGWYGDPEAGNYLGPQVEEGTGTGGTSIDPNSGVFLSPELQVPNIPGPTAIELRFKTWWEIESVNPSNFDIMSIEIDDGEVVTPLARLNPTTDPAEADRQALAYTSGGFKTAPSWENVAIDIRDFRGQTVRVRFVFNTVDERYNGFRGWMVDDVRVSTGTSEIVPSPNLTLRRLQRSRGELVPADKLPRRARP
jgi:hypothetical protein